jgi:hypothetical protein
MTGRFVQPIVGPSKLIALAGLSVLAAIVSLQIQGNAIGVGNNYFHLSIMARLYDLPQFQHDQFIQSLRRFVSFIYPLLSIISTDNNVRFLLLVMDYATRALYIFAFLLIAYKFGVSDLVRIIGFLVLLVTYGLMYGSSPVGIAGLFAVSFSHSELAQAIGLISIYCVVEKQYRLGAVLLALTFDLNAFVGVWCAVPIILVAGHSLVTCERGVVRNLAISVAIVIVCTMPVAIWIFSLIGGEKVDFSYVAYLRSFFPFHFLIDVAKVYNLVFLTLYATAGIVSLWYFSFPIRWLLCYIGFVVVFVIGIFVPYLINSPNIINLHLLRVDGMILSLAIVFLLSALVDMVVVTRKGNEFELQPIAVIALTSLALAYWPTSFGIAEDGWHNISYQLSVESGTVLLALIVFAWSSIFFYMFVAYRAMSFTNVITYWQRPKLISGVSIAALCVLLPVQHGRIFDFSASTLMAAALAACVGIVALKNIANRMICYWMICTMLIIRVCIGDYSLPEKQAVPSDDDLTLLDPIATEWRDVTEWVEHNTATDSVFLIPSTLVNFEFLSRRVGWWTNAQGSAVLWQPSFYDTWIKRKADAIAANTLQKQAIYACDNNIAYIIDDLRPKLLGGDIRVALNPTENAELVYHNAWFNVYKVVCNSRN